METKWTTGQREKRNDHGTEENKNNRINENKQREQEREWGGEGGKGKKIHYFHLTKTCITAHDSKQCDKGYKHIMCVSRHNPHNNNNCWVTYGQELPYTKKV